MDSNPHYLQKFQSGNDFDCPRGGAYLGAIYTLTCKGENLSNIFEVFKNNILPHNMDKIGVIYI